jgi:hypothetical protein
MAKYEYVECRAIGHSWDQIPSTRRPAWGELMTFRCVRCGTVREDVVDLLGQLSYRSYNKPEDYSVTGENRPSRSDWRRQMIQKNRKLITKGKPLVAFEADEEE